MDKYVCIHGHFYQPPRENAWLEDVELQDSAYPYHDWNARITEECYRQNAASRILGPDRKIVDIVNNYERISFNFGPTLLYWLQTHAPDVYDKILEADRKSQERFSGHGCALAQAYNHMILPLCNSRDKHTQVVWGIEDFKQRFQRAPEGMWLPETAVDIPSLEVLAEHGMRFTILAPRQAKRVRGLDGRKWRDVTEADLDTSVPYLCHLPSGRQITLFFYCGGPSHDIAYGGLLHKGENFAGRLIDSFPRDGGGARLVHVATDGESFGHHHRYGDMALAYCLHHIETHHLAKITIYGEFLEKFPPNQEVEIWENSSWSCAHGVERWKSNCGCAASHALSGQQQWRAPLRHALDWLRDKLIEVYERRMSRFHPDPWQIRNEYIHVINDRSSDNVEGFITKTTGRALNLDDKIEFLKLLEMQRDAMLMYTSCGWFFDYISGIETVQVMQYAARAMQLGQEVQGWDMEPEFKGMLQHAPANTRPFANGTEIYEAYVQPARIDLSRVAAHFALSSVFEDVCEKSTEEIYCYSATLDDCDRLQAGMQILTTGRATIQSNITLEHHSIDLVVFYLGDHNLFAAIRSRMSDEEFQKVRQSLREAFRRGDSNEVMRLMNVVFGGKNYSLTHLFKDQQRELLNELLDSTWEEIESAFRHVYEHNYAIMQMIRNMNMPLPKALSAPAEFILNEDLCAEIQADQINVNRLQNLAEEAERLSLGLDKERLTFEGSHRINDLMDRFEESSDDVDLLASIEKTLEILRTLTSGLDLQNAQNVFFTLAKQKYPDMKRRAAGGNEKAARWVEHFGHLAQHLGLAIP